MSGTLPSDSELDEGPEDRPYLHKPLDADTRLELAQIIADFVDTHEDVRKLIDLLGDTRSMELSEFLSALQQLILDEPELWQSAIIGYRSFVPYFDQRQDESMNQLMFAYHLIAALNLVHGDLSSWSKGFDEWITDLEVKDVQDFKERVGL